MKTVWATNCKYSSYPFEHFIEEQTSILKKIEGIFESQNYTSIGKFSKSLFLRTSKHFYKKNLEIASFPLSKSTSLSCKLIIWKKKKRNSMQFMYDEWNCDWKEKQEVLRKTSFNCLNCLFHKMKKIRIEIGYCLVYFHLLFIFFLHCQCNIQGTLNI